MAIVWQTVVIIVSIVLTFVLICHLFCASARAVNKYNAQQTQLQAALNPNGDHDGSDTVEHRHEVAIK